MKLKEIGRQELNDKHVMNVFSIVSGLSSNPFSMLYFIITSVGTDTSVKNRKVLSNHQESAVKDFNETKTSRLNLENKLFRTL